MIRRTIAILALAGASPLAFAAPANLTPGMWETEMTIEMLGQTMVDNLSECMDAAEASAEVSVLADDMAGGMGCSAGAVSQKGNVSVFGLICPADSTFSGGAITFDIKSSTNFVITGDVTVSMPDGSPDVTGTLHADAKRTGTC